MENLTKMESNVRKKRCQKESPTRSNDATMAAKLQQKDSTIHSKATQNHWKFIKNPSKTIPKSSENEAWGSQGGLWAKTWFLVWSGEMRPSALGHVLGFLGHFWDPPKILGGTRNGPKNLIRRLSDSWKQPWKLKKQFWEGSKQNRDF